MTAAAADTEAATTSAPLPDPSGSRAASDELARLFEAHARRVRLVCVSMLRDAHEADDALQQSFLSAYRSLLGGSVPRDAAAWLATIARNECRARIRDRMARPLADVAVETLVARDDPASAVVEREQLAVVLAAVGALPDRERQAVVLQAFGGVSNAEVAARLGTTESAVESILVRARAHLRALAWPVVAGARALALAPVGWVRGLLFAPGAADVVAVAKVGTAVAVVGSLVAVGPSVTPHGHHGGPPSLPAKARASLAPDGTAAAPAALARVRSARAPSAERSPTVGSRVHRAPRPPVRVAPVSAAAPAPSDDDAATAVAAGSSSDGGLDSGPGGSAVTSGSDDGTGSGARSGSSSGPGSGSGFDTSGSDDGVDGGTSGERSGSGSGPSDGEAFTGGDGFSDPDSSGSGGSGSDDPSGGSSGSGSNTGSGGGSGSGSGGSGTSGGDDLS